MDKNKIKEFLKLTKEAITVFILFILLYFFLPKPTYFCIDGCYFLIVPVIYDPSMYLYGEILDIGLLEFLFTVFIHPIISLLSIPGLLSAFLQGELPSGPNDFNIHLFLVASFVHITLICVYFKLAQKISNHLRKITT